MITLKNFLLDLAEYYLPSGRIKLGHNGPYFDLETPVRNYSHWLITFKKCYELTSKKKFLSKVKNLAEYLTSKEARPHYASFYHRKTREKDKCNGLIGQAWTIEALVEADKIFDNKKYIKTAEEVFLNHNFNFRYGLWHRLSIGGKILTIDPTFNHQLWFAAAGSKIFKQNNNKEIGRRVALFLSKLEQNVDILESGLIYHPIKKNLFIQYNLGQSFGTLIQFAQGLIKNKDFIYKSIGYQTFNLYAFSLLKNVFPDHSFWQTKKFKKTVSYIRSNHFQKNIINNKYAYPYNAPGFEIPVIKYVFGEDPAEDIKASEKSIQKQIAKTYNGKKMKFNRNTDDENVLTARIYELTRIPEKWLNKIKVKYGK